MGISATYQTTNDDDNDYLEITGETSETHCREKFKKKNKNEQKQREPKEEVNWRENEIITPPGIILREEKAFGIPKKLSTVESRDLFINVR